MPAAPPIPPLDPQFYRQLVPGGHVGPGAAAFGVYGIGVAAFLVPFIVAVVLWLQHRRVARRAEASFDPAAPLQPGGETVLRGKVEHAANAEHAVRVEVTQEGTESENSGVYSHAWTEVDRRVLVHPFYLRLEGRGRVRVEPDDKVFLVDELDGLIQVDRARRVRIAELTAGEQIYASGVLTRGLDPESTEGAYRDDPQALVLRSPRRRPMLLSSEPLGARFLRRAWLHAAFAVGTLMVCIGLHGLLLPYHLRQWAGISVEGTIEKLGTRLDLGGEGPPETICEATVKALSAGTSCLLEGRGPSRSTGVELAVCGAGRERPCPRRSRWALVIDHGYGRGVRPRLRHLAAAARHVLSPY